MATITPNTTPKELKLFEVRAWNGAKLEFIIALNVEDVLKQFQQMNMPEPHYIQMIGRVVDCSEGIKELSISRMAQNLIAAYQKKEGQSC